MSKIQGTIKGFPLIKFQSKERIEAIRQGKIYMKSLQWYREHEMIDGDTVVGDMFDGVAHFTNATLVIPELNETINITNEAIQTNYSNDFAFCMFHLLPNSASFKFSEEQKNELKEFGDTALLITDTGEFFKRFEKAAQTQGYKLYKGKVNYYDPNIDNANMMISMLAGMHNVAFWKRQRYSSQQEYRMLLHSVDTDKDHYVLDIGDISDISIVIKTTAFIETEIVKREI